MRREDNSIFYTKRTLWWVADWVYIIFLKLISLQKYVDCILHIKMRLNFTNVHAFALLNIQFHIGIVAWPMNLYKLNITLTTSLNK